jgi:hypothetical protein
MHRLVEDFILRKGSIMTTNINNNSRNVSNNIVSNYGLVPKVVSEKRPVTLDEQLDDIMSEAWETEVFGHVVSELIQIDSASSNEIRGNRSDLDVMVLSGEQRIEEIEDKLQTLIDRRDLRIYQNGKNWRFTKEGNIVQKTIAKYEYIIRCAKEDLDRQLPKMSKFASSFEKEFRSDSYEDLKSLIESVLDKAWGATWHPTTCWRDSAGRKHWYRGTFTCAQWIELVYCAEEAQQEFNKGNISWYQLNELKVLALEPLSKACTRELTKLIEIDKDNVEEVIVESDAYSEFNQNQNQLNFCFETTGWLNEVEKAICNSTIAQVKPCTDIEHTSMSIDMDQIDNLRTGRRILANLMESGLSELEALECVFQYFADRESSEREVEIISNEEALALIASSIQVEDSEETGLEFTPISDEAMEFWSKENME